MTLHFRGNNQKFKVEFKIIRNVWWSRKHAVEEAIVTNIENRGITARLWILFCAQRSETTAIG